MNSETLELAPAEKTAVAVRPSELPTTRDPEALLRYAVEKGATVETIERLMNVRRELRQEQAKEAFDFALAAFQADCPIIKKTTAAIDNRNSKVMYHYAKLDTIVQAVQALLQKHGFSYSISTEVKPGWVKASCRVTHNQGHSETSQFEVPATSKSPMMNDPQMYASALTFSKRYAFCNAFGILTGDEDTDARTEKPKPAGPSTLAAPDPELKPLARELWTALKSGKVIKGDEKDWTVANQWLWREEILDGAVPEEAPNLSAAKFNKVIAAAKERLK